MQFESGKVVFYPPFLKRDMKTIFLEPGLQVDHAQDAKHNREVIETEVKKLAVGDEAPHMGAPTTL